MAAPEQTICDKDRRCILLLCPPGRRVYHRDNYCSHEVKANYYWHPHDLVMQSGVLAEVAPVEVLDATALALPHAQAIARLARRHYRAVLALAGGVCWDEDVDFLCQVAQITRAPLFLSGDVPCAHPRQVLELLPFVTGILMDYTSRGLVHYLAGQSNDDVLTRETLDLPVRTCQPLPAFSIPLPRWDLFPSSLYRLPFQRRRRVASVAASFGCPHNCNFCTAGRLRFKQRDLENLMEELRFLHHVGYRELHFRDLDFAADPLFCSSLLERMVREGFGFTFSCLARADELSPGLATALRQAGCHLIHVGVESASDASLMRMNKRLSLEAVRAAVDNCRECGIEVVASYILGLPWENRADVERTIDFALALGSAYASFNTYTVRGGWPPPNREWPPNARDLDYDLERMRHYAYRRFYFRPSYIVSRLRACTTPTRLALTASSGWELFKRHCCAA